jgi:hypothetical protein
VDVGHQLVGVGGDHGERPDRIARRRLLPVLPKTRDAERRTVLHGDGIGLLGPLSLDRIPLEKAIHRDDTTAHAVGVAERRQITHGLALGIDGLAPAGRVLASVGNKSPTQRIEGDLAGLVIAPDDQQLLARRGVPAGRIIVDAAVPHVHAIDDGITNWPAALDDSPTHPFECRFSIPAVNLR